MLPSAATLPDPDPRIDASRSRDEVQAMFLAGPPWRGSATRIFAWLVRPSPAYDTGAGVVLMHGGGGTAHLAWARAWATRGYTAIAPDACGCLPEGAFDQHPRHAEGGPPGWGALDQTDWPVTDQWPHHACAAALQARRLLASQPGIDPGRIGITGNSWGGVTTIWAAAAEPAFAWYAPVYGCGFLHEDSWIAGRIADLGPARAAAWIAAWDPSRHIPHIRMPGLWATGTNDFAFPLTAWERSVRLAGGPIWRNIHPALHHADGDEVDLHEIATFAMTRTGPSALTTLDGARQDGRTVSISIIAGAEPVRADLLVSRRQPGGRGLVWTIMPARIEAGTAVGRLCDQAVAWSLRTTDGRGLVSCGPVMDALPAP